MKEGSLFCFVVIKSIKLGCFRSCSWCLGKTLNKNKNHIYKIKDENPSIKSIRQMKVWVDRTQRKNKANNQQEIRKRKPYANKTQGYKMLINDNK
jgi:hypothetical protein